LARPSSLPRCRQYKIFTNIQEKLTKCTKCTRENARNSLPTKDISWLKLVDEFGQSLPLLLVSFCRNQQAKLAGNAEKTTTTVTENFLPYHRKFSYKNLQGKR
jgi:hypothetical protein